MPSMEKALGSIPGMVGSGEKRRTFSKPTTERKVSPGGFAGTSLLCGEGSLIPTQQSRITMLSEQQQFNFIRNLLQSKTVLSIPGLHVQVLNQIRKETDFVVGQIQIPYVKYQLDTQ